MTQANVLVVGNSDGVGLALTQRLLDQGYHVEGISRSVSSIEHAQYRHTLCDVTDPRYVGVLGAIVERVGHIEHAVYCAGIGESTSRHGSTPHGVDCDGNCMDPTYARIMVQVVRFFLGIVPYGTLGYFARCRLGKRTG
jgi:NAD(P)-dependent dehydrogenase (short-subunit alcohol dehydrogenase family)